MTVALNHLRRNRRGLQSQARADLLFEFRRQMREDADRAGELSDAHVFGGSRKARDVALRLRIPVSHLETEGDGLGMDAVRAPHHRRVFEFPGAALEHVGQTFADLARLAPTPA